MGKVVLITGASSGIGLETARLFAAKGWKVFATMRHPPSDSPLYSLENVEIARLDVLDTKSIASAISLANKKYGRIDVLVNNAGYGLVGPVEGATRQQISQQAETNLVGLIDVTRQVLPFMRAQKSGAIVNVSSMGGRVVFPLYSMYHATKFGVEGFTESLAFELEPFGIKVRLIEPGMIDTDFYSRSMSVVSHPAYSKYEKKALGDMHGRPGRTKLAQVAQAIYSAATDKGSRLRYPVGSDAMLLLALKQLLPGRIYGWVFKKLVFR
ncbi:MAG TPA: SDR family oxidoreductase [Candidatus Micrarchaeota archaeon]|nr:SDR family oxidoreductase [Candidatus Micrarchaeota archaeon]